MIMISDILYFASVDPKLHSIVKNIYKQDPNVFRIGSSLLFDIEQRNILNEIVGEPAITDASLQTEINQATASLCEIFHERISLRGQVYLHNRGISDEEISTYRFGDSTILDFHFDEVFHNLRHHSDEALHLLKQCLSQYTKAIMDRYSSPHFISLPSYRNGEFTGVVFRTVAFKKREDQMRNMFKFYSPYNFSYMFNEDALDNFDEINIVEGVADALALIRLGYKNTISPSMVRLSPKHIEKLKGKKLNVLFDQDMGGLAGLKYIADHVPEQQLNVLALTPRSTDFDEEDEDTIHSYMAKLPEFDIRRHVRNENLL